MKRINFIYETWTIQRPKQGAIFKLLPLSSETAVKGVIESWCKNLRLPERDL